MRGDALSDRLAKNGAYKDLSEYQQLKAAAEMYGEATAKLKEHVTRAQGEKAAKDR